MCHQDRKDSAQRCRRAIQWLLLAAEVALVGGCGAAVAAPMGGALAAGAAEGAAGAAVEKSDVIYRSGKFETFQPVSMSETIGSVRRAAGDLALSAVNEEKHSDQVKMTYKDQRHQEIVVTLVPRTVRSTEIHVDVGLFGTTGSGQLMMRQILADLPERKTPDKLPEDGHHQ